MSFKKAKLPSISFNVIHLPELKYSENCLMHSLHRLYTYNQQSKIMFYKVRALVF